MSGFVERQFDSADVAISVAEWVRCRVNQVGGMGILEHLNRTFKYDFVFRHEANVMDDLKQIASQLRQGYNQERLHSSLGYKELWQLPLADGVIPS